MAIIGLLLSSVILTLGEFLQFYIVRIITKTHLLEILIFFRKFQTVYQLFKQKIWDLQVLKIDIAFIDSKFSIFSKSKNSDFVSISQSTRDNVTCSKLTKSQRWIFSAVKTSTEENRNFSTHSDLSDKIKDPKDIWNHDWRCNWNLKYYNVCQTRVGSNRDSTCTTVLFVWQGCLFSFRHFPAQYLGSLHKKKRENEQVHATLSKHWYVNHSFFFKLRHFTGQWLGSLHSIERKNEQVTGKKRTLLTVYTRWQDSMMTSKKQYDKSKKQYDKIKTKHEPVQYTISFPSEWLKAHKNGKECSFTETVYFIWCTKPDGWITAAYFSHDI